MKIYVLTQGNYSDYHIIGVFTDKEKADRMKELTATDDEYDHSEIEEFESDIVLDCPVGLHPYKVEYMEKEGTWSPLGYKAYRQSIEDFKDKSRGNYWNSEGRWFYTFARDEKAAIKIMVDLEIELKQKGEEWKK